MSHPEFQKTLVGAAGTLSLAVLPCVGDPGRGQIRPEGPALSPRNAPQTYCCRSASVRHCDPDATGHQLTSNLPRRYSVKIVLMGRRKWGRFNELRAWCSTRCWHLRPCAEGLLRFWGYARPL